jgi:hypothetical protein
MVDVIVEHLNDTRGRVEGGCGCSDGDWLRSIGCCIVDGRARESRTRLTCENGDAGREGEL